MHRISLSRGKRSGTAITEDLRIVENGGITIEDQAIDTNRDRCVLIRTKAVLVMEINANCWREFK
jgi:hypothetical protein